MYVLLKERLCVVLLCDVILLARRSAYVFLSATFYIGIGETPSVCCINIIDQYHTLIKIDVK